MNHHDLTELGHLLDRAAAVRAMEDIYDGQHGIGMRHDCDNVIEPAVQFAAWEAERGYRATYYILHTAPYFADKMLLRRALEQIAGLGHEIGIHNNALAAAVVTGEDPRDILARAIDELRGYGFQVRGTVAHGDPLCYGPDGNVRVVNDELFVECPRPRYGRPDRTVAGVKITPTPLAEFGLSYDANWLPRSRYLSDSGGSWSEPFDEVAEGFPYAGQLHVLAHPDWWLDAFQPVEVAA